MVINKTYESFIEIVDSRTLTVTYLEELNHYHLFAKDGVIFYQTYIQKVNDPNYDDFMQNVRTGAYDKFQDVSIPVVTGNKLFTKAFTNILVLSKNEYGDPLIVKSVYKGVDAQLLTIEYDEDGDFLSASVSDL